MKQTASSIYQPYITALCSLREALERLNHLRDSALLYVLDSQQRLVGTLSDREIRNGLLQGYQLSDSVGRFMNADFAFVTDRSIPNQQRESYRQSGLQILPLLDEQQQIIEWIDLRHPTLPLDALIMAGGEGKRLRPWTEEIPKPLLPVGEKPILAHILDLLAHYGVRNVHLSTGYKSELVKQTIGAQWGEQLTIQYWEEREAMGTIGSARLIDQWQHEDILVMNADLLTNFNLGAFFQQYQEQGAEMAIATTQYEHQVPYAVLETHYGQVYEIREKPRYRYHANAGIYLCKRSALEMIPDGAYYNATDLVQALIKAEKKVIPIPLNAYWLDIGTPADYQKAQEDIRHLQFS